MAVDIVIVSYNGRDLLRACLKSVADTCGSMEDIATIVVDNASRDGSPEMVREEFPWVRLLAMDTNLGFGPANNRGTAVGQGEYVLYLNSDAELTPGALEKLVGFLDTHPRCAIAGPALRYPDGRFQRSCRRFPSPIRDSWCLTGMESRLPNRFHSLQNWLTEAEHIDGIAVDMVSGACFLARRQYMEEIGGFEEKLFLYEEEFDISYPARARDMEVRYVREAIVVHHHGGSSRGSELQELTQFHAYRSKYYCFRKHYGALAAATTYGANRCLFGLSALRNRLSGRRSPASTLFRLCREGYMASRQSFVPSNDES